MATITLRLDTTDFQRAVRKLKAKAPVAIARALNRAAVSTQTAMGRAVKDDIGLPVAKVKAAIKIDKATRARPIARIEARGTRIPLIDFRARGPYPSRGRGRGVTAYMPNRKLYPHAFIAKLGRNPGVYKRKGLARFPVRHLRGPSIVHVFEKHRAVGIAAGEASLTKNLSHEFRWALEQAATTGS
jgi:hypothetical protein